MAQAPTVWADSIGTVSDEFKNAVVDILDPSLVISIYDVDTDVTTYSGDPVIAAGIAARIQPVRLAVDTRGASTANPSGEVRLRVQIPRESVTVKIRRGWIVRVTESIRNPELLDYVLVVDSAMGSSWRAGITMECAVNVENEGAWS